MSTSPTQPYAVKAPVKTGPAPFPIALGLLGLIVAVLVGTTQITSVDVNWRVAGPASIVVLGAALLLIGAAGLLSSRRRRGAVQPASTPTAESASWAVETSGSVDTSASATQRAAEVEPPTS